MSDERPFREPCNGESLCGLGPLWSHGTNTAISISGTINTTLVPNPVGGDDIPPYERWTQDFSGGLSCEVHHCAIEVPCSQFQQPFPEQTFGFSGTNNDFSVCHKQGFKNVQAKRCWNGRFGYKDIETSGGADTWIPCSDGTYDSSAVGYRSYKSAPQRTRYLQIDASASWANTTYNYDDPDSPVPTTVTETANVTEVIDSDTGILNPTAFSCSPDKHSNRGIAQLAFAFYHYSDVASRMVTLITPGFFEHVVWTSNSVSLIRDSDSSVAEAVTWDIGAGTFTRDVYSYGIGGGVYEITLHEEFSISDTTLAYHRTETSYTTVGSDPAALDTVLQIDVSGTLSSPITDATIYTDLKALLGYWNLADDVQYPWRQDLKVSVAPLVSRDELSTNEFDSSGFYLPDYGVPITDVFGFTMGDEGWLGDTGAILNPNPDSGVARTAIGFGPDASGETVDIQVSLFSFTAQISCTVIGGSFPSGVSMDGSGHITGTIGDNGRWGVTIEATGSTARTSGEVLGAPKPNGYENYWDFRYLDIRGCCYRPEDNPGFQTWSWYQRGWGGNVSMFNTDASCSLPLTATQWTNFFQSVNKSQGAFIFFNDPVNTYYGSGCVSSEAISGAGDSGALFAGKYAEILEMWPTQNFARPAGDDKYAFDENHVFCAVNLSGSGEGSTWTLTDTLSSLAPPDGTDFSGIWGGPVVDGFYSVASYSGGTLTLDEKVADLPSNWVSKSEVGAVDIDEVSHTDADFCFGKLRFPTAPALLGRCAVTPDVAGTTFTFATPQPNFGMDSSTHQEQIDLYDRTMTLLASSITATRVDDSTFTTVASYPTAKWVQINGSASWYVNDTRPKGYYAFLKWLIDYRGPGESNRLTSQMDCSGTSHVSAPSSFSYPDADCNGTTITVSAPGNGYAQFCQAQDCLPFDRCNPRVVCISPNGESFPNGVTYEFPEDFVCDQQYGNKWWAYVQSTMTDLLWQRPHRPCNIESCAKWTMDSFCAENTGGTCPPGEDAPAPEYFFGHAPQVETSLSVPDTYGMDQDESGPALPSGIQIGWLSPVDNSSGDIAFPPLPPGALQDQGEPGGANVAWNLHASFCASAPGCRFTSYADVPGCPPPEI